jgi:hypothetical protein
MKHTLVLLILFISSFYISSCSSKMAPEGHYQDTPVVADGNAADWQLPLRFSNEKYTFQYNVTNDNKFLYICILSTDPTTQNRILKDGMTIYFDPKGKKKTDISLAYPTRQVNDRNSYNGYRNRNGNPIRPENTDSVKNTLIQQSSFFVTKGFVNIENGQFGIHDRSSHIQVGLKLNDDSLLVYEAVVPINLVNGNLSAKKASKNFSIGIALNAVPGTGGANNNSPRPSFGGGGMRGGMMGGGMMRGGFGGGGGRNYNSQRTTTQAVKEEDTWYEFRLAGKGNNR